MLQPAPPRHVANAPVTCVPVLETNAAEDAHTIPHVARAGSRGRTTELGHVAVAQQDARTLVRSNSSWARVALPIAGTVAAAGESSFPPPLPFVLGSDIAARRNFIPASKLSTHLARSFATCALSCAILRRLLMCRLSKPSPTSSRKSFRACSFARLAASSRRRASRAATFSWAAVGACVSAGCTPGNADERVGGTPATGPAPPRRCAIAPRSRTTPETTAVVQRWQSARKADARAQPSLEAIKRACHRIIRIVTNVAL